MNKMDKLVKVVTLSSGQWLTSREILGEMTSRWKDHGISSAKGLSHYLRRIRLVARRRYSVGVKNGYETEYYCENPYSYLKKQN